MNNQLLDVASGVAKPNLRPRRRRSALQWRELVAQHAASDVSVAVFCEQRGLVLSSFYAWRRRLKHAGHNEVGGFVELRAEADAEASATAQTSRGHRDCFEIRLGAATLLVPLSSLVDVIAALSGQVQQRC